jgi:acetyl esterase/lipase
MLNQLLFISVLSSSILFGCNNSNDQKISENISDPDLKEVRFYEDIPYRQGASKSWVLDLAAPVDDSISLRPAIVIVHGGGWRAGSKEDFVYRSMMITYALKGYVTVSVEYRLTQEAPFPACIEDVKCAVRWLRAHAEEYRVDPDHIGAFGHSAGAHLALMLAMCPPSAGLEGDGGWDEYSSKVNSVVGGSTPVEIGPQRPEMAKPEWWPIGYISENEMPPMLLIQGGADPIVKPETVDSFVALMKKAGHTDLEYIRIDELGHDVSYSTGLSITSPAIDKFFERTIKKVTH